MKTAQQSVGKRLIIQHGERITRHELTGRAVVIGRDPSCDLFFADQKLSRRHARIESGTEGVKLIDLSSRNGSWVNEQRVDEHVLQQDDKVRLGRLQITVEEDLQPATPSPAGDATVVLASTAVEEDAGKTVRMDLGASATDRTGEVAPHDDTVLFNEAPRPDRDRTVILSEAPAPSEDAGTVIFQLPTEGGTDTTTPAVATPAPTEPALRREKHFGSAGDDLPPTGVGVTAEPVAEAPSARVVHRVGLKPLLVTVVLSFVAYLLVAVPLVLTTRGSLREESLARGRALVDLLAVQNEAALAAGNLQELSADSVRNEPGVEDAVILDVEGRVLAPGGRSGQSHEAIETAPKEVLESGGLYLARGGAGDYDLVRPLIHRGERVGFAVLRYSVARVAERKSVPVLLFLGFLLIAGGAWGAYFLSKKQALERVATETTLAENPDPTTTI